MKRNDFNSEDKENATIIPPPPPMNRLNLTIKQITHENYAKPRQTELDALQIAIDRLVDAESSLHPKPFYRINTHLQSQLQEGPKCGLVALSIATTKTNNFKSCDALYELALKKGYTRYGEIFSCQYLADLAETCTVFKSFIIEGGLTSHINCIFHCLQNGGLLLVPYDADFNHSPCCKKGHFAHWAVISGIVIFKEGESENNTGAIYEGAEGDEENNFSVRINSDVFQPCNCIVAASEQFFKTKRECLNIVISGCDTLIFRKKVGEANNPKLGKIYLAGKQGKSKHLALWSFEKLAESNDNLTDLSVHQRTKNFVLPHGGISEGLKGKAVLINLRN